MFICVCVFVYGLLEVNQSLVIFYSCGVSDLLNCIRPENVTVVKSYVSIRFYFDLCVYVHARLCACVCMGGWRLQYQWKTSLQNVL